MKIIALLTFLIALGGCTKTKPANPVVPAAEKNNSLLTTIRFDGEMHDFGKIKAGEIVTFSFVFTNVGKNSLRILRAKPDCNCISVKLPEAPVEPNESETIDVTFNSSGEVGKQLKTIEIEWNSKEPKHLVIFADVENELFNTIN